MVRGQNRHDSAFFIETLIILFLTEPKFLFLLQRFLLLSYSEKSTYLTLTYIELD